MSKDIVSTFIQDFYDLETQLNALFYYIKSEDPQPVDFGTQWALIQNTSFNLVTTLSKLYFASFKMEIPDIDEKGNSVVRSGSGIVAELVHKLFLFCTLKAASLDIREGMLSDLLGLMFIGQVDSKSKETESSLRSRILELADLVKTMLEVTGKDGDIQSNDS